MTNKPSTAPFHWATGSASYRSPNPIPTPRQDEGLQNGDPADPLAFNSLLGNVTDWTVYLGQFSVSTGVDYRTALQIWDSVGGASLGYLGSSAGDILLSADDGLILQAAGSLTPTIYLDDAAGTVRLQSNSIDAAVAIRDGWALNDNSFRLGFGDTVGDGTGYPVYTWDHSPSDGCGWAAFDPFGASSTGVGLYILNDYARLENQTGGVATLQARAQVKPALAVSEDGATARWTVTEVVAVFTAATTAQPTVKLIRTTRDGANTRTVMATCQPTAVASRQTITDNTITSADLDFATYRYFLEWEETGIANTALSRGVEQVLVRVRTRAGA